MGRTRVRNLGRSVRGPERKLTAGLWSATGNWVAVPDVVGAATTAHPPFQAPQHQRRCPRWKGCGRGCDELNLSLLGYRGAWCAAPCPAATARPRPRTRTAGGQLAGPPLGRWRQPQLPPPGCGSLDPALPLQAGPRGGLGARPSLGARCRLRTSGGATVAGHGHGSRSLARRRMAVRGRPPSPALAAVVGAEGVETGPVWQTGALHRLFVEPCSPAGGLLGLRQRHELTVLSPFGRWAMTSRAAPTALPTW